MIAAILPAGMRAANPVQAHTAPEPRLVRAAHEFEAQLMKELLRPLTESSGSPGGEENEAGGAGALSEFAAESLAGSLSMHGGLGIAGRIVADLSRSGNGSQNAPVTGKLHVNTVINPGQ